MMKTFVKILFMSLIAVPTCLFAGEEKFLDGQALVDRHIKAVGGREAMKKAKSATIEMKMEMQPVGVTGRFTVHTQYPKTLTTGEIDGAGAFAEGTDGETYWERTAFTGPRVLEGREKRMKAFMAADFDALPAFVEKYETLGIENVAGKPCDKVRLHINELDPATVWFDKATGLAAQMAAMMDIQGMGRLEVITVLEDYRDVGGVKVPYRVISQLGNMRQVMTIESMKIDVDHPQDRFGLPPDIKQIVERKRESGSTSQ